MTRRPIAQLPPDLVNRIAAGEVIERPASVVKELVENALDAGARRITVEIEDGGRSLVRVIDDGAGIARDELPLAFAQHATSKLRDDLELAAIQTMGFRGEALASIGSVSRARILSRCGEEAAWEIRNDGGRISPPMAAAGNAGTAVEVRDLFFNTPARRKFLKSAAAESGQVTDMLIRLALPRADVHFRYVRDGKVVGDWPAALHEGECASSERAQALYAESPQVQRLLIAWPAEYVEAFCARPMCIDASDGRQGSVWRLRGIVGLPEFAATAARYQHFYVNGRAVRDRSAGHALREAYRGLTEPGRHPAAVLMLQLPPDEVDVNVHPTKAEVRFRDASRVWSLVHSAVREALLSSGDLAPKARPQADPPAWSVPREDVRHTLASFFKEALGQAQQRLEPSGNAPAATDALETGLGLGEVDRDAIKIALRDEARASRALTGSRAGQEDAAADRERRLVVGGPAGSDVEPAREPAFAAAPDHSATPGGSATVRAIQLHNSYLVVQSDDGMEIIDQHALHERIIFEDLLARLKRGAMEGQRLLLPVTFEAPEAQVALVEELSPALQRLGIEAEAFGPRSVAVHAFPSFLARLDPAAFITELLSRAEGEHIAPADEETMLHEVLDMMACRAAVKAGDPLTPAEIAALVERRGLVARSSNCPHGRPTTLRLSLADLERQFKRTGF